MRTRIGLTTLALATGLALMPVAHADAPGTPGPDDGADDVFVTYVGCEGFFEEAVAPQTRIDLGPFEPPLGRRSLALVPSSPGTAAGPFSRFASLAGLDAGVSVSAPSATSGVSYIWAITPDVQPGTAWSGRAEVAVAGGGWHEVRAASLRYDWSLVDLGTGRSVTSAQQATPAELAASHGDGHGYVVTGFGCDGHTFNIDAVRVSGGALDYEGVPLTTTIEVPDQVASGEAVMVSGTSKDAAGQLTGDPLVLESRAPTGVWTRLGDPHAADADGVIRADLVVTGPTEVRWFRPESAHADAGWSDSVLIQPREPDHGPTGQ